MQGSQTSTAVELHETTERNTVNSSTTTQGSRPGPSHGDSGEAREQDSPGSGFGRPDTIAKLSGLIRVLLTSANITLGKGKLLLPTRTAVAGPYFTLLSVNAVVVFGGVHCTIFQFKPNAHSS